MHHKWRLLAAFALALVLWTTSTTQFASAQSGLTNGSFDGPYSGGVANGWAPWHEERNGEGDCSNETILHRPSWGEEVVGGNDGQLWFDGTRSQHIGNNFATWHAGVFQSVSVSPGTYSFSTRAWGRASQDQYPASSDRGVPFAVRVGIDPTGSGLWSSSSIIWSSAISPHDNWQQVAVEATTTGDRISVFISANFGGPGFCRKHLDVWFDGAALESTAPAVPPTNVPPTRAPATATRVWVPTATPKWNATLTTVARQATPTPIPPTSTPNTPPTAIPTNTPLPPSATPNWNATATVRARNSTPTPNWNATLTKQAEPAQQVATAVPVVVFQPTSIPVVVAVPTAEPVSEEQAAVEAAATEEPTPVPVPTNTPAPQGGTICVNTFADANANGLRDSLEGYMANVPLIIGRNGTIINQGTSNGTDAPICFEGLEAGEYEVAQRLPGGLEMTTAGNLSIDVAAGQVIGLEFGSRVSQVVPGSEAEVVADAGDVVGSAENNASANAGTNGEAAVVNPASNSGNTLTIVGIALAGVAVLLLAGVLIALLRK